MRSSGPPSPAVRSRRARSRSPAKYEERRGLFATALALYDGDVAFLGGSFTGTQQIEINDGLQTLTNEEDEDGAGFWIAELGPR